MKDEYELNPNSICSDLQTLILTSVQQDDIRSFRRHLSANVNINYIYDDPYNQNIGEIICGEGKHEFLQIVIDNFTDFDINKMNEHHLKCPIHFAIESGDVDTVKTVIKHRNFDVNVMSQELSVLHFTVKHLQDIEDDRELELERYNPIILELLNADANPNIPDGAGRNAIYSAAKFGFENILKLMVHNSKFELDLDKFKDYRGKTCRDLIMKNFPYMLEGLPEINSNNSTVDSHQLFYDLSTRNEEMFIRNFNKLLDQHGANANQERKILTSNNGTYTLLQFAVDKGLAKCVQFLLQNGADPNFYCLKQPPAAIACEKGNYKILKMLTGTNILNTIVSNKHDSLLQLVVKDIGKPIGPNCDYRKCFDILMTDTNIDINATDYKDNTALHYAVKNNDEETILKLLENGAYIGKKNVFKVPPIADISPITFEKFLDSCVQTNGDRVSDDDYELIFNYDFLVPDISKPPTKDACAVSLMDDSGIKAENCTFTEEMHPIIFMSKSRELKHLITHPVIASFLHLKWNRLKCFFRTNLAFYTIFCLSLICYILIGYGKVNEDKEVGIISCIVSVLATFGLCLLIIRECFQLLVSPRRYLTSFENYLEMCLIGVTVVILFCKTEDESDRQQLSAVAILLSAAELMLLIGQTPSFSTNNVMLRTVSWNFLKFLALNSILIIAFSLSFYTLFRQELNPASANNQNGNDTNTDDEEPNFFMHPAMSLFKTIVMLTGEFDASSIKFGNYPVTSHIIFVLFVFLIAIVLFNLLNGLAVSDTQAIKSDAELVGLIQRAQLLSYYECVLLGNINLYGVISNKIRSLFCCIPRNYVSSSARVKPFAKIICLFPAYLPLQRIHVRINQCNIIEIPTKNRLKKSHNKPGLCCTNSCNYLKMDNKIMKSAKCVLDRRAYEIRERCEKMEKIDMLENKIVTLEQSIRGMEMSMEKIFSILTEKHT